jgi:hypothetical protein
MIFAANAESAAGFAATLSYDAIEDVTWSVGKTERIFGLREEVLNV